MKIVTCIASVVTLILVLTACSKRDYTCSCTYTDISGVKMKDVTTVKGTKTHAKNACDSHQGTLKYYAQSDVTCLLM